MNRKYTKSSYKTTNWSGGTTTELFIYPPNSNYVTRSFLYRISSAVVDLEKSEFTKLQGIRRKLMVLQGNMQISHEGKDFHSIPCFTEHSFMGDWNTQSIGKCVDFNLMMQEGIEGHIEIIDKEDRFKYDCSQVFLYVYTGETALQVFLNAKQDNTEEKIYLSNGDSFFIEAIEGSVDFSIKNLRHGTKILVCPIKIL